MSVSDDDITRIHDRLDKLQEALDTRLRAVEIWQAQKAGQITVVGALLGCIGTVILSLVAAITKYYHP